MVVFVEKNSSSPTVASISSTASLTSTESSFSSCSDSSVDSSVYDREYIEDSSSESCQEDSSSLLKGHLDDSNFPIELNNFHQIGNLVKNENGRIGDVDNLVSDRNSETAEFREVAENNVEKVSSTVKEFETFRSNDEEDAEFWLPPGSEDQDDDVLGSSVNYDDDEDDCGDGVTWAKPSSLRSCKLKEEKIKAMNNVRSGRFKGLVSQLIKSMCVDSSGNYGENWVDIVTSLSWEAASFVKPDAHEGKAMDPDGYVKVKCIATSLCTESQVIRGLVFKKHAAHKHMPTIYKNARLLLIHGSLDLSSGGFLSLESMQQEKETLKSIVEMIEMHNPNVILVEKSVSRDIQESILAKGMTLVFDMKLHRLNRVANWIGSPISSSGVEIGQKLGHCDFFHIEKFEEEHAVPTEGEKKPRKTLMFLEGSPTRHGCTILLKGAATNELKRIKCVVHCAVVMAYHMMLETSFLLDQSVMFSTISSSKVVDFATIDNQSTSFGTEKGNIFEQTGSDTETSSSFVQDVPINNAFPRMGSHNLISSSEVMNGNIPLLSESPNIRPIESNGENHDVQAEDDIHHRMKKPDSISEEEYLLNTEELCRPESPYTWNREQMHRIYAISTVLNSESILVLMSRRNASNGSICEQSHFSHIKFYRRPDVPLGNFLHDNLLNQKLQCKTCGEPHMMHLFYYMHYNKQLTIQVRNLCGKETLPGETEGKIWMWSRCGHSMSHDGNTSAKSTKRVLVSAAARGLSFGKFLELGFSNLSSFNSTSSRSHSLHTDFLYFFGLGPMVAMFKYSPVVTYSVSLPPQKMEFTSSIRREVLQKDYENVYLQGISMFLDIEKALKDLETRYARVTLNIYGSSKEFSHVLEMLKQEKSQFEVDIQSAVKSESENDSLCELLILNRIRLELLLESCIWDRRLHALLSSDLKVIDTDSMGSEAREHLPNWDETYEQELHETYSTDENLDNSFGSETKKATSTEASDFPIKETHIDGQLENRIVDREFLVESSSDNHASDELHNIDLDHSPRKEHQLSSLSNLENDKIWIWAPFTDIRRDYIEDLQRGYLPKIESFSSYTAESTAQKLITNEGSRLHIPLGTNEYIVSDYEDEFSSIIACALTLIKDLTEEAWKDAKSKGTSQRLTRVFSLATRHWSSFDSPDSSDLLFPPSDSLGASHSQSFDGLDLFDSLVLSDASHPEVSMGLGKYPAKRKYSVVCIYTIQFRQLRERYCSSEVDYIASLSRCRNWDAKGGKSKSFFAKTLDDKYIIKEIQRTEFDSFMKFATSYFEYLNQCYMQGNQTCLAKILGIYQVVIRATKNRKETRHALLVMENLSYDRHIARQYDLKGALHARFKDGGDNPGDVLLDQNFVNDMNGSPLYVSRQSKRNLQRAIYNDTNFLNSINVMDYSLLVGVDTQRLELVCGIIDYLRQYTWDKQLENWAKSSLVVPKNQLPTIISPKEYKKRFRKFVTTYFLSVPDHWCAQRSSNP